MVGKTLVELELPKKFGVMVVGVRKKSNGTIIQPSPSEPLKEDENLIIVSNESAIPKLVKGA
jgi:trk system potassium uptake protein TrkA